MIFQTIENPDARVTALTNGDVDMHHRVPAHRRSDPEKANNVKVVISDPVSGSLRDIFFNVTDPANCPPDNPGHHGRQRAGVCSGHPALRDRRRCVGRSRTAIDKQQLIDVAQLGSEHPA